MTTNKEIRKFVEEFRCKSCRVVMVDGEPEPECDNTATFHEIELVKEALKKFKS